MQAIDKYIRELIPYQDNPRINDDAVPAVAESIRQFGFKKPILIDSNNFIVCGHTRLKAAILLGMETVPCVVASGLTDEQIRALRIADNKTGELADWDIEKLKQELSSIDYDGLLDFDFDGNLFTPDEPEADSDEAPEDGKIVCPRCGAVIHE